MSTISCQRIDPKTFLDLSDPRHFNREILSFWVKYCPNWVLYEDVSNGTQFLGALQERTAEEPMSMWVCCYKDGILEADGQFTGGKREGLWNYYYDNGQVQRTVNYEADEVYGPTLEFDREGKSIKY